jgi:hypothetical protein
LLYIDLILETYLWREKYPKITEKEEIIVLRDLLGIIIMILKVSIVKCLVMAKAMNFQCV